MAPQIYGKARKKLKNSIPIFTVVLAISAAQMPSSPFEKKAEAQLVTFDPANLIQQILQILNMIEELQNSYEDLTSQDAQLEELENIFDGIIGGRGMGDIANNPDWRRGVPGTVGDIIKMDGEGDYQQAIQEYYEQFQPIDQETYAPLAPNNPTALANERWNRMTAANLAASANVIADTEQRLLNIEEMIAMLNETEDIKASMDLQGRISAELGIILTETMRMMAIQQQLESSKELREQTGIADQRVGMTYDEELTNGIVR